MALIILYGILNQLRGSYPRGINRHLITKVRSIAKIKNISIDHKWNTVNEFSPMGNGHFEIFLTSVSFPACSTLLLSALNIWNFVLKSSSKVWKPSCRLTLWNKQLSLSISEVLVLMWIYIFYFISNLRCLCNLHAIWTPLGRFYQYYRTTLQSDRKLNTLIFEHCKKPYRLPDDGTVWGIVWGSVWGSVWGIMWSIV